MTRPAVFLYFLLVSAILIGCSREAAREDLPSKQDKLSDTARILCDDNGIRVLTPRVEAQPDGVHLMISNRLEGSADLSVSHAGGGMGWSIPSGESKRIANVPPGKIKIDCYSRSWGRDKALAAKIGTVEVLAGDSGYKSTKLDCPRDKSGKIKPYSEEEMDEQKGDPVEIFRRSNSGSLREGDIVEIAGNTRSPNERTVRVVRDGEVVATAHYLKFSTGWLEATEENCVGF